MENKNTDNQNDSYSTFHTLVKNLSQTERSSLLSKLVKYTDVSDNFPINDTRNVKPDFADFEESKEYVRNIYSSYGILRKILIFIISFFNSKSIEETIIFNELDVIKHDIQNQFPKYFNLDENKLKPLVLERIVPLINVINEIKSNLGNFCDDKVNFFELIVYIVEKEKMGEFSDDLNSLSPKTLENNPMYLEKNNYNIEKDKRIKQYLSKVNTLQFVELNRDFIKLDVIFKMLDFDFSYLARLFKYNNIEQPLSEIEELYITDDVILYYERLYKFLLTFDPEILKSRIYSLFIEYLKMFISNDIKSDDKLLKIKNSFENLIQLLNEAKSSFPYESFIKYSSSNILKSIAPVDSKINIVDIYKTYKKTLIDKLWESEYIDIKAGNVKLLINRLFGSYEFDSLEYLNKDLVDDLEKYSGFKVKDFYNLNILYKFITTTYYDKISPVANKIIIDGQFVKDIIKSNFSSSYYIIKSGSEKIKLFDLQFKDDTSLRKKINSTLMKISSDQNFKNILLNVITDINEESSKIKIEISESLKLMGAIFKTFISDDISREKILRNFDDIKIPIYPNMFIAVESINEMFDTFNNIFKLIDETL